MTVIHAESRFRSARTRRELGRLRTETQRSLRLIDNEIRNLDVPMQTDGHGPVGPDAA